MKLHEDEIRIMLIGIIIGLVAVLLFCQGCTSRNFQGVRVIIASQAAQEIYNPVIEKAFCYCIDPVAFPYNIHSGRLFAAPMVLCEENHIAVHAHPIYAIEGNHANVIDFKVWEECYQRYGKRVFGVMKGKKIRVYERKK